METDRDLFEKNYRAVLDSKGLIKVYNEKSSLVIDKAFSFDSEKEEFTSIDYFVSSIVSELVLTMTRLARKKDIILQDIEAKVNLEIENPLYLLNVIGIEEKSFIRRINIDLYFFSFLKGEDLDRFLEEVKDRTLIYNTLEGLVNINFKTVL